MKIQRSDGITLAEKYLKQLCDRAFLSLWSYPGIYRDQKQNGKGQGKELCDLLVVFEDHILIFSDKYIQFPDTGNPTVDWARWYRRAVKASAEQIFGAERWIRSFPDRLFLDPNCTQPFPIKLPDSHKARFHRLVVVHGVAPHCAAFFGSGSGSLIINNTIHGDAHCGERNLSFCLGQVDITKGYVHVLDDVTLDIVLQTLDTVTDFVNYLDKKEKFLTRPGFSVMAAGEEDLLAYYLGHLGPDDEHDFVLPKEDINGFTLTEGFWQDFVKSPERKSQIEANRVSYFWDALIEVFNKHILEDTQYYAFPAGPSNQDRSVRFLARESRTRRRMLATSLLEITAKTPATKLGARVFVPSYEGDPYYVFLLLPMESNIEYAKYREMRRDVLQSYCMVTKYKFPDAEDIVGFATESGRTEAGSEDLIYLDARNWTEEMQSMAKEFHDEIGLLRTTKRFAEKVREYPAERPRHRKKHLSRKTSQH